jgi:uncharacterized membrane protein YgcG
MNPEANAGLSLAAILVLLGAATGWFQLRGLRALRARQHVPSDEFGYLRSRHRRRLLTGVLLAAIGGLIAGAYLGGLEARVNDLGQPRDADPDAPKPQLTDEQKALLRFWGVYWIAVVVLAFAVLGLALTDALATRRYAMSQYHIIREDHEAKLRRDLAVFKQQKQAGTRGGRLGGRFGAEGDQGAAE